MWFQILTCLFILRLASSSILRSPQLTNYDEQMCLEIYTTGYKYENWYNVAEINLNSSSVDNNTVLLKFYVQGARNALVMLTSELSLNGYEIVLGGGLNTFYDLRKSSKSMNFIKKESILNKLKPIGFWIKVSYESGLIEVGNDGESIPFMFWADPSPIPVKYFSFSSWDSDVCKWLFKCQPIEARKNSAEKVDHLDKFLTYSERLRRDVLKNHRRFGTGPPIANPQKMLNIAITNNFKFIHLDIITSTLTLRGYAVLEWKDDFINWNPVEYKNISKLHLSNYELWQPELVLHNAMDPGVNIFSEEKISVDYQGNVTWKPKFSLKTKCDIDLKSWPWDQHKCTLLMSSWSHKISNIFYEIKANNHVKCFQMAHSDWKLDRMTSSYVEDSTPWDDILASVSYADNFGSFSNTISLQIVVEISRNTKILEKLFYVPLILISVFWLSSFWVMSNSASKITTICVSIILSTSIVVYMTTYVPVFTEYYPPNLMLGYLKLMALMSTDALVSSFLVTARNTTAGGHPPFAVTRFLTRPAVTGLLLLPRLDPAAACPGDRDKTVDEDDSRPATRSTRTTTLWDIVIVAFERIVFVAYSAITAAVLFSVRDAS